MHSTRRISGTIRRPVRRARTAQLNPSQGWIWFLLTLCSLWLVTPARAMSLSAEEVVYRGFLEEIGYIDKDRQQRFENAVTAYRSEKYHLAHRILVPLARSGHVDSQFYLGMMYDTGNGVSVDPRRSVLWYFQAARAGHRQAQHNLAVAYAHGEGVATDIHQALKWWKRAARQGSSDAQYNLGVVYATGRDELQPDPLQAAKWWRMAAINGDVMAQYNLGTLYANGEGTHRSYCEAERWWEKSAASGFPQARIALSILRARDDFSSCWQSSENTSF